MRKKITTALMMLLIMLLSVVTVYAADADGLTLSRTKAVMNTGDSLLLSVKGAQKAPVWISYNENIVRIDGNSEANDNGEYTAELTAVRKGKTTVRVRVGKDIRTCTVTVKDAGIKLNKTSATLYCGADTVKTLQLKATIKGADKNSVTWESDKAWIAKVDEKGKVTPVTAGTATITATANGKSASCTINVKESAVSLNLKTVKLSTKGTGSTMKITPVVTGASQKVKWTTSNSKVAVVSGGKIKGKEEGTATITATANGKSASCRVTVVKDLLSINEEAVVLYTGSDKEKDAVVQLKTNASKSKKVKWTSSNPDIASVDEETGKVTAKGEGSAVITAELAEGGISEKDSCKVEVRQTVTSVIEEKITIKNKGTDNSIQLHKELTGKSSSVKWTSADSKIAVVNKNGKVTAKGIGTTTITAKANGVTDSVQVEVVEFTPTIKLNQSEYVLYTVKGNTVKLKAAVNGKDKTVTWKSSNETAATVDRNGKVTAKGEGDTVIEATANGVTAQCRIRVKESVVKLEKTHLVLKTGQKEIIPCDIIGKSQSIKWKSKNAKVAAVSKGMVTAKKEGEAVIEVTANGVTNVCTVTVNNTMAACEHTYTETLTEAADCMKTGEKTYICSKCGHTYEEVIPKAGHTYGNSPIETKEATCTEGGYEIYACTAEGCGSRQQVNTEALSHSWGDWETTVSPTESYTGVETKTCSRCGETETREIPLYVVKGEYKLKWEDNFDGSSLNRNDWNVELHDKGWVNNELQEYVDSEKNIYVKDGMLVIQALKDGDNYTSGRINTQNKHDYKYGRFEARAKVPSGQGFLPAFWMMPTDENLYGQWPKCGEIDIMEVLGSATKTSYSTLHFGEPHTERQGSYTLTSGDFSEEFHIYACEWEPGEIRFYVDDKLTFTANDWFTKREGFGEIAYPAPYDQPFYMILNLAVGGNWPGNPNETTEFGENATLQVDYVRVYQKDAYDEAVEKPEEEPAVFREPDATGNYIVNGDFSRNKMGEKEAWNLLLAQNGAATAKISNNKLQIITTEAGDVDYSVQIIQPGLPMLKGMKYKLSFDARAEEVRTMKTGITAPDKGYIRYLNDTVVELTTEKQTYEYEFTMLKDNDANGRLEFNLGNQGSVAKVEISNVRLEIVEEVEIPDKTVLPDGNYVYNGEFNEGSDRMAYWTVENNCNDAAVYVSNINNKRELVVDVKDEQAAQQDIVVRQNGIALVGEKDYVLSFTGHADAEKTIKATIAGNEFEAVLSTDKQAYTFKFHTGETIDDRDLKFYLGQTGILYLDDVRIQEDGMLINGDFSNGLTGYEVYVHDSASLTYGVDSLTEKNVAACFDISDTGADDWNIQLKQNNITLEKGKWYKLKLDAKSDRERKIMYALQRDGSSDDNWIPYSGSNVIELSGEYQTFEKVFQMTNDTDEKVILSISMGAVGGERITEKHRICIDNISLEETEALEIPEQEDGTEMIKNGNFAEGETNWEKAVTSPGEANVSFENGKAVYEITNVGETDWHIQLKQAGITFLKGSSYKVSFKVKSTEARTVKYAFLNAAYDWYGGEDLVLTAGEEKTVESTITVDKDSNDNISFVISMGKIEGEETPASVIEISEVSLKKVSTPEPAVPEIPEQEEGTELIRNGDFAAGQENWENAVTAPGEANVSFENGKAVYEITNVGEMDWHVQLKQAGLTLVSGSSYEVSFKIKSTEARTVKYALLNAAYDWYGGEDLALAAGEEKTVDYTITVDKATDNNITFVISMGKIDGEETPNSTIEITDISIRKVSDTPEESGDDNTEPNNDEAVNPDAEEKVNESADGEETTEEATEEETTEEATEEETEEETTEEAAEEETEEETTEEAVGEETEEETTEETADNTIDEAATVKK